MAGHGREGEIRYFRPARIAPVVVVVFLPFYSVGLVPPSGYICVYRLCLHSHADLTVGRDGVASVKA